jgi:hypothetical protein
MSELTTWAGNTAEALPCPFCGTAPEWRHQGNNHTKSRRLVMRCPECRCEMVNGAIRNDFAWLERITLAAWNRRAASAQSWGGKDAGGVRVDGGDQQQ